MTGSVKWFSSDKGFGFIVPDAGGEDVFVHHSDLDDSLKGADGRRNLSENQRVEFEAVQGARGPKSLKAIGVRLLGD